MPVFGTALLVTHQHVKATSRKGKWPVTWVGVAGFEPAASSSRTMYFHVSLVWLCGFRPIKSQVDGLLPVSVDAVRYRPLALSSRSNDGQTILGRKRRSGVLPEASRQGRSAALHGVLLGRQRSRTLGRHVPEQEGCRPRVATGRGEGSRGPIRRSGPRAADVPGLRGAGLAAGSPGQGDHTAEQSGSGQGPGQHKTRPLCSGKESRKPVHAKAQRVAIRLDQAAEAGLRHT